MRALLMVILLAQSSIGGCAMSFRDRSPAMARHADEDWGGVEVLERRDGHGEELSEGGRRGIADTSGELLVVFVFVGAVLAAAALPFLLL